MLKNKNSSQSLTSVSVCSRGQMADKNIICTQIALLLSRQNIMNLQNYKFENLIALSLCFEVRSITAVISLEHPVTVIVGHVS